MYCVLPFVKILDTYEDLGVSGVRLDLFGN